MNERELMERELLWEVRRCEEGLLRALGSTRVTPAVVAETVRRCEDAVQLLRELRSADAPGEARAADAPAWLGARRGLAA